LLSCNEPIDRLKERLQNVQQILTLEGNANAKALAEQLIFGGAVATLEAFLWETVDYWVENDEAVLRNIVTKTPSLKDQSFKLGEIFDRRENIKEIVRGYLQNLVWHRWEKVSPLLKFGLEIEPPSFKFFVDILIKRHDIVHRSGHDKLGNPITVTREDISKLCMEIEKFAEEIDQKLKNRSQVKK